MTIYSNTFSKLYDSLMEEYEYILHPTQTLVYEFTQGKNNVDLLELGCGTGTILKAFPKSFTLSGLDIAQGMLEIARKKVKRATFYEGDMSTFKLNQKFDVIICVFDSINHLTNFKKWKSTFKCAAQHLKSDGIFVFDMNTEKRHKALINLPAYVKKGKNRLVCVKVLCAGENLYNARFEIFTDITKRKVSLIEENVYESSFPVEKVKKELSTHFTIEKMIDPHREKVTSETGRIFFVCKKL